MDGAPGRSQEPIAPGRCLPVWVDSHAGLACAGTTRTL